MSHFTKLNTNFQELPRLLEAARKLKLEVVESQGAPLYAQGFMDNRFEAIAVIKTGTRYDIGVVAQEDGTLELVADWELIEKTSDLRRDALTQKLKQNYALATIEDLARKQGMSLSTPTVAEDGSIEVTVSQW